MLAIKKQEMTSYRVHAPLPKLALLFLLLTVALLYTSHTALAQDDAPATGDDITTNEVNEVARELWCPLCSGVRLDVCELKACEQMREEIAIKLEQGQETEEIKRYFVTQYGPQVLGEPPKEGFNLLAWILPVIMVVGGGAFVLIRGRRMFKNRGEQEEAQATTPDSTTPDAAAVDEGMTYAERLDEELSRYD